MKTIQRRILSLVLAFILLASFAAVPAFATTSDIGGHWAESTLQEWISQGLLDGYNDGNYRPNGTITRAEFIALVNRVENFTDDSGGVSRFVDVGADAWYRKDIAIALAEGYISGTAGNMMSPDAPITREQAMTIIGRIHDLDEGADTSILLKASDNGSVSDWALSPVAAVMNAGYVTGDAGKINPKNNITRAETIVLLDRVRTDSRIFAFSGSYGPATGTLSVKGNVTIAASGVTLQNAEVGRNLTISSAVGEGEAHINNVAVKGNTYVEGGGMNSLYVADFRVEGSMIVRKYEGENVVRIVVSGESNFNAIVLETGAILVTQQLADGTEINVEIPADYLAGSTFEFSGNFDNIVNNGKDAEISINGSVNKLTLNESAQVSGAGKIVTAEITAGAGEGASFETAPLSITGAGKDDITIQDQKPQPAGPTIGSGGSGGGSGGGGGGGGTTTVNVTSVTPLTSTADHNGAYTLPATVTANLSGGGTKDFAVTWMPAAADTSICGTFVFEGTLTMVSGYANPSIIKAQLTLTVNPVIVGIAITQVPAKYLYNLGEELVLDGLIVTGDYSDGSTAVLSVSKDNITGYDANTPGDQILTVTAFGFTDTFSVSVFATVVSGDLVAVLEPGPLTLPNGVVKTAAGLNLPLTVEILVDDGENDIRVLAPVDWNVAASVYDPDEKSEQSFLVYGTVSLPNGINNPLSISLNTQISITVLAAFCTVDFDLNGQPGESIPSQTVAYGGNATEPNTPTSVSHNFGGWHQNAAGTGEAWDFTADSVTENVTLYAKWEIRAYTISFNKGNANGDPALPNNLTINHGSVAVKPADPVLAGYNFIDWYTDSTLETPYNWSASVTSSFTLYAKFGDTLTEAKDALTFDVIRGANTNEQSILTNLGLPTSLLAYPDITITWASSNPTVISSSGVVTRPASTDADASVTLTATLELNSGATTKEFFLIVRKQGVTDVVITGDDERYASGYPVVSFDSDGKATLKIKLKPGVATTAHPVIAYFAMDGVNAGEWWTFDRGSILFGHLIDKSNSASIAYASGPFDEFVIDGDDEYMFITQNTLMHNGQSAAIGVVLLADDDLNDPLSVATVIQLTAEEAGYVDTSPPSGEGAVFNTAGDKIFAYLDKRVVNTASTLPPAADFVLVGTDVTVTGLAIAHADDMEDTWPSWLILSLSGSVNEATQNQGVELQYTAASGVNILTDTRSNAAVDGFSWWSITPAKQTLAAYVNPSEGTLLVQFSPAIDIRSDYVQVINNGAITLLYQNAPVGHLSRGTIRFSIDMTNVFFTFDKITSGEPVAGDFTVAVTAGMINTAFEPIMIPAQIVDKVMPAVTTAGVSAVFNVDLITVTLPGSIELGSASSKGYAYTLLADGKRVLVRGNCYSVYNSNQVYLNLNARQASIISGATSVTLYYDPDAEENNRSVSNLLVDISGAFIPAFGPVTVTK